jgi:nicotinamide-nucleotide amidase
VAISGVAGPGGGSEDKPVGTVWFAWGGSPASTVAVVKHFEGDRDQVRRQAVLFALQGISDFLDKL